MADVTFGLAQQVIAAAGFGYNVAWKDDGSLPESHPMVCARCCRWSTILTLPAVVQERPASVNEISYLARPPPRLGAWVTQEREDDSRILHGVGVVYARDASKSEGSYLRTGAGAI